MPVDTALFAVGYPLAVGVITRFAPIVRRRRAGWLAAHHVAMTAIIAGWALRGEATGVAINTAWLAGSSLWYAAGRRGPAGGGSGGLARAEPASTNWRA